MCPNVVARHDCLCYVGGFCSVAPRPPSTNVQNLARETSPTSMVENTHFGLRAGVRSVAFKAFRNVGSMEEACRDKNLRRELDIGIRIHHPNLFKVYGIVQIGTSLCLVVCTLSSNPNQHTPHPALRFVTCTRSGNISAQNSMACATRILCAAFSIWWIRVSQTQFTIGFIFGGILSCRWSACYPKVSATALRRRTSTCHGRNGLP